MRVPVAPVWDAGVPPTVREGQTERACGAGGPGTLPRGDGCMARCMVRVIPPMRRTPPAHDPTP